jgi:hypothetical protein
METIVEFRQNYQTKTNPVLKSKRCSRILRSSTKMHDVEFISNSSRLSIVAQKSGLSRMTDSRVEHGEIFHIIHLPSEW